MQKISDNIGDYAEEYEKYKGSLYHNLKYKCGKTIKSQSELRTQVKEHPLVVAFDEKIQKFDNRILKMQNELKNDIDNYKKRIKQISMMKKDNLNELEKNIIRMVLKDERKTLRNYTKMKTKETNDKIEEVRGSIKRIEKRREKKYQKVRKTLKSVIAVEKKQEKKFKKARSELRKTLRKQDDYSKKIDDKILEDLVFDCEIIIDNNLEIMQEKEGELEYLKEHKKQEKIQARENKKQEREQLRITKKNQKNAEKEAKKLAKKTRKNKD